MYISRNIALRKLATETEVKEDTKTEVFGWKTDLYNNTKEENKSKEENNNARDDIKDIFNKRKEKNNEEVEVGTRDSMALVLHSALCR